MDTNKIKSEPDRTMSFSYLPYDDEFIKSVSALKKYAKSKSVSFSWCIREAVKKYVVRHVAKR